jgi:hypothetical protein
MMRCKICCLSLCVSFMGAPLFAQDGRDPFNGRPGGFLQQRDFPLGRLPKLGGPANLSWGGMHLDKIDAMLQEEIGLADNEGQIVTRVDEGSPAAKAGLKATDVLVKINDKVVPAGVDQFMKLVSEQKADMTLTLVVVRDGQEVTLKNAQLPALADGGFEANKAPRFGGGRPFGGVGKGGRLPIDPGNVRRSNEVVMVIKGGLHIRRQTENDFYGEYSKGDLKITVLGKVDNGIPKVVEITVVDGMDTRKFNTPHQVPEIYQSHLQRIVPAAALDVPPPAIPGKGGR